jgi:hypothetical protein
MSLLKLWFIHNPVLVSYSICMRQGSSDLSGSQSALACLCVCARAQLGLWEFNRDISSNLVLSCDSVHARARSLVGWLSGRLDFFVRPYGRATGVAGVGVV